MTIGGWVFFAVVALFIAGYALAFAVDCHETKHGITVIIVAAILIIALLFGLMWYFHNTAAGQRAMVDQKSNLNNGMYRTVTVYTANGDVIAEYTGVIDIEANDGGYIKFDFEGKRYMYYNCFVESIANISE